MRFGIVIGAMVLSIAHVSGMESLTSSSSSDITKPAAQQILRWNPTHIKKRLEVGGIKNLRTVLLRQARVALYMAQKIKFIDLGDEESHVTPLITAPENVITRIWFSDGSAFEDWIQAYWIYVLAETRTRLKKNLSYIELINYAWRIRLFLDDVAAPVAADPLEGFDPKNSRNFLRIVTKDLITENSSLITNLLNLGIFKYPLRTCLRGSYVREIVESLPEEIRDNKTLFTGRIEVINPSDVKTSTCKKVEL